MRRDARRIKRDAAPGGGENVQHIEPATALLTFVFSRKTGSSKLFDEKVPHLKENFKKGATSWLI
jgi:hypothetical protein